MSAASEAFDETVVPFLDDAVAASIPLGENPQWALVCSGQVVRLTMVRRRPNGTMWFEGEPVEVEGFNNVPRRGPSTLELRRRCARDIARAEGLKDNLLREPLFADPQDLFGRLSAAQLNGTACAYCHKPASVGGAMVPLKVVHGLEYAGVHSTLFVCDPDCRVEHGPDEEESE